VDSDKRIFRWINPLFKSASSSRGAISALGRTTRIILSVIGFFANLFIIVLAVLSGNFVGDRLRAQISAEAGHQLDFIHQDEHGNTFLAANLLLSNFLPGVLLALLFKPRAVFGFLGGLVASFFLGERYEDQLWETMDDFLAGGDPTRNWPTPAGRVELDIGSPPARSKTKSG
jgi:hypothetical protein